MGEVAGPESYDRTLAQARIVSPVESWRTEYSGRTAHRKRSEAQVGQDPAVDPPGRGNVVLIPPRHPILQAPEPRRKKPLLGNPGLSGDTYGRDFVVICNPRRRRRKTRETQPVPFLSRLLRTLHDCLFNSMRVVEICVGLLVITKA